jgi:uncharacterized membrane protein YhdT
MDFTLPDLMAVAQYSPWALGLAVLYLLIWKNYGLTFDLSPKNQGVTGQRNSDQTS